jgi:hypothetical protein
MSSPQDWNLTVQRMFKMPLGRLDQQALTFRAEFFNAFNHPNLGINNVGNTISYDLQNPDFANVGITRKVLVLGFWTRPLTSREAEFGDGRVPGLVYFCADREVAGLGVCASATFAREALGISNE